MRLNCQNYAIDGLKVRLIYGIKEYTLWFDTTSRQLRIDEETQFITNINGVELASLEGWRSILCEPDQNGHVVKQTFTRLMKEIPFTASLSSSGWTVEFEFANNDS